MPTGEYYERTEDLEGQIGVAKSKMLPSGQIIINGKKFDATSESFAIEPGDAVIVSDIRGNRIYVEPYEAEHENENDLPARDRGILENPINDLDIGSIDSLLDE